MTAGGQKAAPGASSSFVGGQISRMGVFLSRLFIGRGGGGGRSFSQGGESIICAGVRSHKTGVRRFGIAAEMVRRTGVTSQKSGVRRCGMLAQNGYNMGGFAQGVGLIFVI